MFHGFKIFFFFFGGGGGGESKPLHGLEQISLTTTPLPWQQVVFSDSCFFMFFFGFPYPCADWIELVFRQHLSATCFLD